MGRSPRPAVHDLRERAAVQPLDDSQRLVRGVTNGEDVGQEPSLWEAQNGSSLVLIGGRGMARANPQVGRGDGHRIGCLAKVVLQERRLPIVLRYWCNDRDRGRRS